MANEPTIEQMNEAIARFMGLNPRLVQPPDPALHSVEVWYNNESQAMKYHTSWDWLMPVVEKISKMPLLNHDNTPCTDPQDVCYPYTFGMPNEHCGGVMVRIKGFGLHIADTLIEATFNAVYEVAEFHNQQKQTNVE